MNSSRLIDESQSNGITVTADEAKRRSGVVYRAAGNIVIIREVEKTIPLENIQDVTFIEGPLLKRFHLSILKFETAGQSAGQAHDMKLVGIIDAHHYRSHILAAREKLKRPPQSAPAAMGAADRAQAEALRAIQHSLEEITVLLKERLPK